MCVCMCALVKFYKTDNNILRMGIESDFCVLFNECLCELLRFLQQKKTAEKLIEIL